MIFYTGDDGDEFEAGSDMDTNNNHPGDHFLVDEEEEEQIQQNIAETRIWGTDVNVQTCLNVFSNFIEYFRLRTNQTRPGM